jgi:hypothetical protein
MECPELSLGKDGNGFFARYFVEGFDVGPVEEGSGGSRVHLDVPNQLLWRLEAFDRHSTTS